MDITHADGCEEVEDDGNCEKRNARAEEHRLAIEEDRRRGEEEQEEGVRASAHDHGQGRPTLG